MDGHSVMQTPLQSAHLGIGLDRNLLLYNTARTQPLCADPEGWGPISHVRYDLTPCFLDLWVLFVAVWGILPGAGALWYVLRRTAQDVPKNWHFYAKL